MNRVGSEPGERKRASAFVQEAQALAADGRLAQARAVVDEGLANYPHRAGLLLIAIEICRGLGDDEEALAHALALIESHPDRREGYARAAKLLLNFHRYEEAEKVIERGLADLADRQGILLLASDVFRACGDRQRALACAQESISHEPEDAAYARAARDLIALGRPAEALSTVTDALAMFPERPNLLAAGIQASRSADDRENSLAFGRRLIEHHPQRWVGYARAAQDLIALGRTEEAADVIRQGLARTPHHENLLLIGLDVARVRGDREVCERYYRELLEHDATDWAPLRAAQHVIAVRPEESERMVRSGYEVIINRRGSQLARRQANWPPPRVFAAVADARPHVYFITRFSIFDPQFGGFQGLEGSGSPEQYREFLYSDARMAFKFDVFENVTAPSIIEQTDQGFTWVILAGSGMRDAHRKRLTDLATRHANVVVDFVDSMSAVYNFEFAGRYATCRIDDDDALHRDVVRMVRARNQRDGTLLSFPWGRRFEWTGEAVTISPFEYCQPNNAQGLTAYGMNVYGCGRHTTVDDFYDVTYDYARGMYLVCCSEYTDTQRTFV